MAKNSQVNWRKAGVEMLGIVFAVLLALGLEAWREDAEQAERAAAFLKRIEAEISENRSQLQQAISENKAAAEGILKALKNQDYSIETLQPLLRISAGSTNDSAWTAAQMGRSIGKMPVETVTALAGIYDSQSYYEDYVRFFFREFTDVTVGIQIEGNEKVAVQKFLQQMSITISLAEQIVADYDTFLSDR